MANHVIQLKLTTEQLMHLNTAISESYDCNFDALNNVVLKMSAPRFQPSVKLYRYLWIL